MTYTKIFIVIIYIFITKANNIDDEEKMNMNNNSSEQDGSVAMRSSACKWTFSGKRLESMATQNIKCNLW